MPITGLSDKRPPYVIFIKGTPAAQRKLEKKDPNTLYYISEKDAHRGALYLGDKLITSGKDTIVTLNSLEDVLIDEGLDVKSLLMFNGEKWVNKTLSEVLEELGPFESLEPGELGLVKAPEEDERDYFLRGDGTWQEVETKLNIEVADEEETYIAVVTKEGKLKYIPSAILTKDEDNVVNADIVASKVSKLNHSLFIGDKKFDGSEDINIEVYDGDMDDAFIQEQLKALNLRMITANDTMEFINQEENHTMTIVNQETNQTMKIVNQDLQMKISSELKMI